MVINEFKRAEIPPLSEDNMNEFTRWVEKWGEMNLNNPIYTAWIDHQIHLNEVNSVLRPSEAGKLFIGNESRRHWEITRLVFEQPLDKFQLPKPVRILVIIFWLTVAMTTGFIGLESFMFWTYWFWLWVIGNVVTRYFKNDFLTCWHFKMIRLRKKERGIL